jgi:predicted RNA-binding Zn-ribbon protein involved in translation (DUF1610 family)
MEIKVECSNCGQHVLLDDFSLGQVFACPTCGQSITARPPVPRAAPPATTRPSPATEMQTNVKQGAAIGGWVCFGLASIIMFIPIPTWFIYVPLFLASFILSIVAMSQRRIASGIALLLANVIGAPVLFIIALAIGAATWSVALDRAHQRDTDRSSSAATNRVSDGSTAVNVTEAQTTGRIATPSAPAAEKIEGAFGKKLGDVFHPAQAIGNSKLTDGTPMYEFATPIGFRSFKRYYVMITPTTHKIYSIWGVGHAETTQAGQKEQAVIMELLTQKYGATERAGLLDSMGDVKRITHGDRYIITKISGFVDVTLEIRYYDGELVKLAEKERLASEVQKADKTGL